VKYYKCAKIHVRTLAFARTHIASDISVFLHFIPWISASDKESTRETGKNEGGKCFLIQSFSLENFGTNINESGDSSARVREEAGTVEGMDGGDDDVGGVRILGLFPAAFAEVGADGRSGGGGGDGGGRGEDEDGVVVPGDGQSVYACVAYDGKGRGGARQLIVKQVRLEQGGEKGGAGGWRDIEYSELHITVVLDGKAAKEPYLSAKEPFLSTKEPYLSEKEPEVKKERAVVTLVSSMDYLVGALVMFHSLQVLYVDHSCICIFVFVYVCVCRRKKHDFLCLLSSFGGCLASMRCSVLQCVAVCCSVLQCVAVCCSVL